jgi:predicted nucleotidyltransferase
MLFIRKGEEIKKALNELKKELPKLKKYINKVILFGSTVQGGFEKYNDIDILVSFMDCSYEVFREKLRELITSRNIIIENAEFSYSNHPRWKKEGELPFHILLFTNESNLTSKVKKGLNGSIDITNLLLDENEKIN